MSNYLNVETATHVDSFEEILPTTMAFCKTKIGTPRDARLQTVFDGDYRYKQAVVIKDDPEDGSKKITWEVIRQNDCAGMRAGFMPIAKYSYGYTSVGKMAFKNFTEAQMSLSIGRASGTVEDKLISELIGKQFVLIRNGIRPVLYVVENPTTLKEVGGSTTITIAECKAWASKYTAQYSKEILAGTMPKPLSYYQCGVTSTSTQRKGDLELFSSEYSLAERINRLTANGLSFLKSVYGSEKLKAEEAIKLATRLSLPETNSVAWGRLNTLAVYVGKLSYKGVDFGDGTIIMNEKAFNRGAAEHGIDLVKSAGTVIQCRAAFIKGCGQVVDKFSMMEILSANKGDGVIFVDVTSQKDVIKAMTAIQKKAITNKLVVFGKGHNVQEMLNVDMFVDLNSLKAGFDLSLQPEISIMEIAHLHDGVNTSSQIIAGAMKSSVFQKSFLSIAEEILDGKFKAPRTLDTISASKLGSDNFAEDLLWKIAPQLVKEMPAMLRSRQNKIIKSSLNKINNLSFKVKGWYLKGICDNGCLFGIKLLHKNEVCASGIKQNDGTIGELFRHPKMAEGEHARVKIVTKETLLKRIRNTPLTWGAKEALARMVKSLAPGAVMLPSWDPELAAKLGGADYDGDGFDLITDRRIVAAYEEIPEGAIHFGKDLPSNEKFSLSDNIVNEAYAAAIHNGNHNVGQLVNFGYKMRAVKADIESGKLSQTIWTKLFSSKPWVTWEKEEDKLDSISNGLSKNIEELFLPDKKAYQPLLTEMTKVGKEIDGEAVKEFGVRVYESDILSIDNFYAILCDLEIAMASVVGRNIDAAKNGAKVFCPLFVLSRMFKSGIKAEINMVKAKNGEEQLVIPKSGLVKFGRSIVYATEDPCFLLKVEAAKYLSQKVEENY